MSVLRLCSARIAAGFIAMTMMPTLASACSEHATGHAASKLLDKSSIPASAFRYIDKPTLSDQTNARVLTTTAVAVPTPPVAPPR